MQLCGASLQWCYGCVAQEGSEEALQLQLTWLALKFEIVHVMHA